MRTRQLAILCLCIVNIGSGFVNTSRLGPGSEKGQQSRNKLSFAMPQGWEEDKKAAAKLGLYRVLVPLGSQLKNADKVITMRSRKKTEASPDSILSKTSSELTCKNPWLNSPMPSS